jgi:hypothetical protein
VFEPGTFNPYTLVGHSVSLLFDPPQPDAVESLGLAKSYLRAWELMFSRGHSSYRAIARLANSAEQSAIRESVQYLGEHLVSLEDYKSSHEGFTRQLQSELARITAPVGFADGGDREFSANGIAISCTYTLFVLRDGGYIDAVAVVAAATLLCLVRYADWLIEIGE